MKQRGTLPDWAQDNVSGIIKACSTLRLTYQIKLLTFFAKEDHGKVTITIKENAVIHPKLLKFIVKHSDAISIERKSA